MTTLKGLFGDKKTKCKRNFIQENMKVLHERQSWQNREEMTSAIDKAKIIKNMPARVPANTAGAQPSGKHHVGTSELSNRTSLRHVSQAAVKQKNHECVNSPDKKVSHKKRNNVKEKSSVVCKGDEEEPLPNNIGKNPHTELSLNMMELFSSDHEKSPSSISATTRSVGCQTVHPKNLDKLYTEGIIRYPSSKKRAVIKAEKKTATHEVVFQADKLTSPPMEGNEITAGKLDTESNNKPSPASVAAGDTRTVTGSCSPDVQQTTPHLQDCHPNMEDSSQRNNFDYVKMNARSAASHLKSPARKARDPLKAPSKYQKGVVPKYLQDRQEAWQKEQEQRMREAPDPACPPGHVSLPECERTETLRKLKMSYAELVEELNRLPVRSDTLRVRQRKMEIEKQLTKLEAGINVFSRPKVFVKIGA